jgi:hypothetical protein
VNILIAHGRERLDVGLSDWTCVTQVLVCAVLRSSGIFRVGEGGWMT